MKQLESRCASLLMILLTIIIAVDDVNSHSLLPLEMLFGSRLTTTGRAPASSTATSTATSTSSDDSQCVTTTMNSSVLFSSSSQRPQHFTKRRIQMPRQKHKHNKSLKPSSIVLSSYLRNRNGGQEWEQSHKYDMDRSSSSTNSSDKISIASSADESSTTSDAQNKLKGRFLLAIVAFLYGTLKVTLRQLYAMPGPPAASVLSFTRGWLTVVSQNLACSNISYLPLCFFKIVLSISVPG